MKMNDVAQKEEEPPVQIAYAYFIDKDAIWKHFNGIEVKELVGRFAGIDPLDIIIIRSAGGTLHMIPRGHIVAVQETSVVLA